MQQKTVLITGATSGIGLELARVFAKHGHNLILVARTESALMETARELKTEQNSMTVIKEDLAHPDGAKNLYEKVKKSGKQVDILVNNAGMGSYGLFSETDMEKELQLLHLNITSLTQLTKLFLKEMAARKAGKIMNVASTAAFQPGPYMAVYYASKAYVLSLTEALATELKGTGVHVTCLCPGPTATPFREAAGMRTNPIHTTLKGEAREVAEYGYNALMKNKVVAVPGSINKVLASATRFLPRTTVRGFVKKFQAGK